MTPKNNRVAIFSHLDFGRAADRLDRAQLAEDAALKKSLTDDGYEVTLMEESNANVTSFAKLNQYGIVIINTHGVNADDRHPAGTIVDVYAGDDAQEAAKLKTLGLGLSDGMFVLDKGLVILTASGITHLMRAGGGEAPSVVFNASCHSYALGAAYGARDYIGYAASAEDDMVGIDQETFFGRMLGREGVEKRTVAEAFGGAGFRSGVLGYQHQPGQPTTVLSPAVLEVSPKDGTKLGAGGSAYVQVHFDAAMDTSKADDVATVEGCDATTEHVRWAGNDLAFDLVIPRDPTSTEATITVHHDRARAASGDTPNHQLDGNADPKGSSGLAPNGDDYVWKVSCSDGVKPHIQIRSIGTIHTNYDTEGPHGTYHYQLDYKWDEARVFDVDLDGTGYLTSTPLGPATLTAEGQTTTSSTDGVDHCAWTAAASPEVPITIKGGGAVNKGSGPVRLLQAAAGFPATTKSMTVDPASDGKYALDDTGSCAANRTGPAPYMAQHGSGTYDPNGDLGRLRLGDLGDIDIDALLKQPFSKTFHADYTEADVTVGGGEHVVASSTVTVTVVT